MRLVTTLLLSAVLIFAVSVTFITVKSQPVIHLSKGLGSVGSSISFTGAGFQPTDATCSLSSPSSNNLIGISSCIIQMGTGLINGGFTVGNVLPGQYLLQATGNQGDLAQTILEVNGGSQLSISHADAHPGAGVSIHATGMLPTDSTCQISSPPSPNVILPGTAACVIQLGSGVAYGGFTVGNVLSGQYVIQITGNQGDSAQTILAVG
ncbi:MAG: hypothetical protein ABSF09_00640 [Candidatus Bathyarchaeia archaeon]